MLEQMATGRTNATIARTLFMSERSVEKHISSVFLKLGLLDEGETNRRVSRGARLRRGHPLIRAR